MFIQFRLLISVILSIRTLTSNSVRLCKEAAFIQRAGITPDTQCLDYPSYQDDGKV